MSVEVVFISFEWVTRALFIGSMEGVSSASPASSHLIAFADKGEIHTMSWLVSLSNSHITSTNKH